MTMNYNAHDYTLWFAGMTAAQHKGFKKAYNVLRRAGMEHTAAFDALYFAHVNRYEMRRVS